MELTGRAEQALEEEDFSRAARYFEALTVAVPEAAIGHRKLCLARSGAGEVEGAIVACREATRREGTQAGDLSRFLSALLARPAALSAEELVEFDQTITHAEQQGVDLTQVLPHSCELGLRQEDDARLASCVARLQATAPADARTQAYAWGLAMRQGDEAAAKKAFAGARASGLDPAKLQQMEAAMKQASSIHGTWMLAGLALALVSGIAALLLARRGGKAAAQLPTPTPASG